MLAERAFGQAASVRSRSVSFASPCCVDNSGDNEHPAGDQLVPRAWHKLVRGKPLVRRRLVVKPDTVYGDAEAPIDVIDDGAPFGSNNINGIA